MEGIDNAELVRRLLEIPFLRDSQRAAQCDPAGRLETRGTDLRGCGRFRPAQPQNGSAAELEEFQQACRIAELAVVGNSGLGPVQGVTHVRLLWRSQWAQLNLDALKPMTERLASRLTHASGGAPDQQAPVRTVLDAVGPLVMGAQFGLVFGYLSHKALGLWDLCLPRGQSGRLYFNYPNIVEVEEELGVDPKQFRMWLAIHEVSHELHFQAVRWTRPYLTGLIEQYIDAAELDSSELATKLQTSPTPRSWLHHAASRGPAADAENARAVDDRREDRVLPGPRRGLQRLVTRAPASGSDRPVRQDPGGHEPPHGGTLLARADAGEAVWHRAEPPDAAQGSERFIAAIAEAGRIDVLWKKLENLPSIEELAQPERWISRVGVA